MIIKIITRIGCLILGLLLLQSCAHNLQAPREVRAVRSACMLNCVNRLEDCRQNCYNSCRCCRKVADLVKARSYYTYKREQCVQGYNVVRVLDAYREPLRCSKTTCNCLVDFKVCQKYCNTVTVIKPIIMK